MKSGVYLPYHFVGLKKNIHHYSPPLGELLLIMYPYG